MTPSPRLIALTTAVPPHTARQDDTRTLASHLFAGAGSEGRRLLEVFSNAKIDERHFCMPLEWFASPHSFEERNALYVEHALRLACDLAVRTLAEARLSLADVDHVVFVSSTGLATPSMDARLVNALGFRDDVRRTPIWGLGCAGGAAGLAQARDFALANPRARVLLIALELCSLTFQHGDLSKRNLVAASLFADGAAAALVVGPDVPPDAAVARRPLEVLASRSTLWKDTLDVMGWTIDSDGLHVVFSRDIPSIVHDHVPPSLAAFLGPLGLSLADIRHFALHPGGVKVMRAYREALGLSECALDHARDVLASHGNMSSPTCLFVLERFLASGEVAPGDTVLSGALGPGFSSEYVLLRGAPA